MSLKPFCSIYNTKKMRFFQLFSNKNNFFHPFGSKDDKKVEKILTKIDVYVKINIMIL